MPAQLRLFLGATGSRFVNRACGPLRSTSLAPYPTFDDRAIQPRGGRAEPSARDFTPLSDLLLASLDVQVSVKRLLVNAP